MANPTEDLMRKAVDALNAGDMETFLSLHSPDVVVHVTGRNAFSGDFHGHEGVAKSFMDQAAALDGPPAFELHDILSSDDHGVILGTNKYVRAGKTMDSKITVVMHIQDGLATELWAMSDDPYAEDEFFA